MGTDKMILLVFIFNGLLFQGVVAGGLQQNREDAERIAHMFAHIDADGNGLIDIGEFKGHEVGISLLKISLFGTVASILFAHALVRYFSVESGKKAQ